MGLLGWFRRNTPRLEDERAALPGQLIQDTTDYLVRMTDPRLALLPRYREKLAPAVAQSLHFTGGLRELLPSSHAMAADNWAQDPCLKAMFARAEDIDQTLAGASELHRFFERMPGLETAHAILSMAVREQTVLGMAIKGEQVLRDVAQSTLSFSEHRIRLFGDSPQSLWQAIARRVLDELALIALARIQAERDERKSLETDCALLRARLRSFERRGTGLDSFLAARSGPGHTDSRKLLRHLEDNEKRLFAMGGSESLLERELVVLREVLSAPDTVIELAQRRVPLDDTNCISERGTAIDYAQVRVRRGGTIIERAFVPVHVGRGLPQPAALKLDEAVRLLG